MPIYKKEYSISQLCNMFRRPEQTIWNWINEGKIKATKVDGFRWSIPSTELKKIQKLNENAKRYKKGWSKVPKESEQKPKRKYTKRKKSGAGRPRKSTAIEVQVPAVLENFCKELNFDLSNAVQSKVDDYCKELISTLKQFK